MQLQRTFLLGVVASLGAAALAAIWVFTLSSMGSIGGQILASTLSVGLFSLTSLGSAVVLDRRQWRPIMGAGIVISALGLLLYLYAIWLSQGPVAGPWLWKSMGVAAVLAVGLPHMGLISLAPPSTASLRWSRLLTLTLIPLLAALIISGILYEPSYPTALTWARAIGVLSVVVVFGSLAVPILVRVHGIDRAAGVESTTLNLSLICPRCFHQQTLPTGSSRCEKCRLKFRIDIEEPRCPHCNYLLHELTRPVCPECGKSLSHDELPAAPQVNAESTTTEGPS